MNFYLLLITVTHHNLLIILGVYNDNEYYHFVKLLFI